ncbi:50S ribosomal protein L13 [Candidatus Peregrinibacteria bacterium]|nr:50S ribosomal protein L13 [Candidatus Peregrinibacteria bacterium]
MKSAIHDKTTSNQKWYLVDAKDKVLGRITTTISNKLRGKDKATFTPNLDCGDYVIVINAEKVKLTGQKKHHKMYYTHSGFPGGLKTKSAGEMQEEKPEKILELAVYGMLPKNRLRKIFMKKLKVYKDETHPHKAQAPQILEV